MMFLDAGCCVQADDLESALGPEVCVTVDKRVAQFCREHGFEYVFYDAKVASKVVMAVGEVCLNPL